MSTLLRPSRVLTKMRAGGFATCVKMNLGDARVAEIAARSGFDAVWADLEHVPNTLEATENIIRAAKIYDVDTIVRVPRGSYSDLIKPLEMDAAGIMVPHLMSATDAKEIARLTRFHPIGLRALDGGNADGGYCTVPLDEYLKHSNEQRLVIVQIEDPEPLEEIDAIAATPGIDMLFFGPGDFTQALGVPGRFDDPRIDAARRKVVETARKHGKFAGTVGNAGNLKALADMGYNFVSAGADVVGLVQYFKQIAELFGQQVPASAKGVYST